MIVIGAIDPKKSRDARLVRPLWLLDSLTCDSTPKACYDMASIALLQQRFKISLVRLA